MTRDEITRLLEVFPRSGDGVFAYLSAVTFPKPGIKKITKHEHVILCGYGRYERMLEVKMAEAQRADGVKRQLAVSDRSWGIRVGDGPLIENNGKLYLMVIVDMPGLVSYTLGGLPINPSDFGIKERAGNYGVRVSTYLVDNITELTLPL